MNCKKFWKLSLAHAFWMWIFFFPFCRAEAEAEEIVSPCTDREYFILTTANDTDLSSILRELIPVKNDGYLTLLLNGSDFYFGSDYTHKDENSCVFIRLCGVPLSDGRLPKLHFHDQNSKGVSVEFLNEGLYIQTLELVFSYPHPEGKPGIDFVLDESINNYYLYTGSSPCFFGPDSGSGSDLDPSLSDIEDISFPHVLTIKDSHLTIDSLFNHNSTALRLQNTDKATSFKNVTIHHVAGQGAALETINSNTFYSDVFFYITGEGVGIRRNEADFIFTLDRVYAEGVECNGEKPTFMEINGYWTFCTTKTLCLSGQWDVAIKILKTGDHKLYNPNAENNPIYWLSSEGEPFNSTLTPGNCCTPVNGTDCSSDRKIPCFQKSDCPFDKKLTPVPGSCTEGNTVVTVVIVPSARYLSESTTPPQGTGYEVSSLNSSPQAPGNRTLSDSSEFASPASSSDPSSGLSRMPEITMTPAVAEVPISAGCRVGASLFIIATIILQLCF